MGAEVAIVQQVYGFIQRRDAAIADAHRQFLARLDRMAQARIVGKEHADLARQVQQANFVFRHDQSIAAFGDKLDVNAAVGIEVVGVNIHHE